MTIWDNAGTCVFVVQDEGPPAYLPCTGISNIECGMTEDGVCQHCGFAMEDSQCPNCGGPAPPVEVHKLGRAVVTLEGVLPQAVCLSHLPEGAELLLCHKCRGDRRVFNVQEVIMRFLHCHHVRKNMPDVAVLYPEQQERLSLRVNVECEVTMYPDGIALPYDAELFSTG